MAKAKRQYENFYPSVTEVISQMRSFSLEHWFKITPYKEIIAQSTRGKEIGKQMHQCIQDFIETGNIKIETEYPDEIIYSLKSFQLFRKEKPKFNLKRSEIQLTSDKYRLNGTLDCLAEVDGILWVGDWKSQNIKEKEKPKPYAEYFTQVSCYVKLYNEVMNTNIENAVIVCLAKDKVSYSFDEIEKDRIEGEFNNVFLPLLKIWEYKKNGKASLSIV